MGVGSFVPKGGKDGVFSGVAKDFSMGVSLAPK